MPERPLVPATRADISSALSYALRYSRGGKRTHDRAALMADAAAEHLVEALHRAGFVIMKGQPAPAHEGSKPDHAMRYGTGDVYVATQDYFVACLNHSGGTQEDTSKFYNSTRAAPFLFDDKVLKLLERTMKASIDIQVFGKYVGQDSLEDYQNFMDTYHKAQTWLADEYGSLVATFNDAMNLSDTRAYPIASVIPIPDPRLLTNKILRSLRLPGHDNRSAD